MRQLLLGLSLAAFAGSPAFAQEGILGAWRVETIGDERLAAKVTLHFDADGRVSGRVCNSFGAAYRIEGEALSIGEIMSTRMACPEPLMSQERRVFDLLKGATRWRRSANVLSIESATGSKLSAHLAD